MYRVYYENPLDIHVVPKRKHNISLYEGTAFWCIHSHPRETFVIVFDSDNTMTTNMTTIHRMWMGITLKVMTLTLTLLELSQKPLMMMMQTEMFQQNIVAKCSNTRRSGNIFCIFSNLRKRNDVSSQLFIEIFTITFRTTHCINALN